MGDDDLNLKREDAPIISYYSIKSLYYSLKSLLVFIGKFKHRNKFERVRCCAPLIANEKLTGVGSLNHHLPYSHKA